MERQIGANLLKWKDRSEKEQEHIREMGVRKEHEKNRNAKRRRGNAGRAGRSLPRPVVTPGNVLLALVGCLFLFSFSVVAVLNLRSIYYFDIRSQQLEKETGYPEETIRENYDILIDYNLITKGIDKLEFPDFPMSENGETHFREVKRIFVAVQLLAVISGVLLLLGLFRRMRRRDFGSLKLMAVLSILLPTVLGIAVALDWENFFVRFHRLFFHNDYWMFDPVTDPVILILPDAFFLHCAAAILLFILLGSIFCGALYRFLTRKQRI